VSQNTPFRLARCNLWRAWIWLVASSSCLGNNSMVAAWSLTDHHGCNHQVVADHAATIDCCQGRSYPSSLQRVWLARL